ncbi:hypothetical protein [Streptomyces niger]|uniref:hypothetical protein n=1 Tax=Streptomyces niger TaxID=66373 RepID=UPI00069C5FD2|nr:hypothetical protein [Streptomyces niger]
MTGEPLRVSLAELRESFDVLLHHLETTTGTEVTLDKEYFWSVPSDELYDPANEPSGLTVGQLSESLEHLRDLLADRDRSVAFHLVWLADVLRAIGHDLPR